MQYAKWTNLPTYLHGRFGWGKLTNHNYFYRVFLNSKYSLQYKQSVKVTALFHGAYFHTFVATSAGHKQFMNS